MSQQPNSPNPDDELGLIEYQASQLVDPADAVMDITDALQNLWDEFNEPDLNEDLAIIHEGTTTLMNAVNTVNQAFETAAELARIFQAQRDEALKTYKQLQEALKKNDFTDPDVRQLNYIIHDETVEMFWESLPYDMADASGLDYLVVNSLLHILQEDPDEGFGIPQDHELWDELKDWIARAEETMEEIEADWNDSH